MNEELKPCPFCGGEVSLVKNESPRLHRPARNGNYYIECGECALLFGYDEDYGGQFDTEKEATEAWNHRTVKKPRAEAQSCSECEHLNRNRCKLFDNAMISDTADKNCGIENEL